jgi:asparagine synthase (glutamine-hydrolysing)
MCSALSHRGPDGAGFALLDKGALAFGHVRLSIIDLQDGDQPLYNEDGSVCITFNGEIYDYKRLRGQLIHQGHRLSRSSDGRERKSR